MPKYQRARRRVMRSPLAMPSLYSRTRRSTPEQFTATKYKMGTGMADLRKESLAGYDEVSDAVTSRLDELIETSMGKYDQLTQDVMGRLRGYGNAQQQMLEQNYRAQMGRGMASLASSGLAGTTLAPSMRMGYAREYQRALNQLGEQIAMMQASTRANLGLAQEQQRARLGTYGAGLQANMGLAREGARAQLGTAEQQLGYQYDALQQREEAATAQAMLGLGGLQLGNKRADQQYSLGLAGLAQQAQQHSDMMGYRYDALQGPAPSPFTPIPTQIPVSWVT